MSGQYTAGQYNDAFKAKHLRNWQYGINHPGKYSGPKRCQVEVLVDARGHFLSECKKSRRSSPWGDYRGSIWEETSSKCICVDRIRNPQHYDRPPCNILVARQRPQPLKEARDTAAALAQTLFRPPCPPDVSVSVRRSEWKPVSRQDSEANADSSADSTSVPT